MGGTTSILKRGRQASGDTPPTAFDWEGTKPADRPRPRVFFDMSIDSEKAGRIEFELASDILPKTVENFCKLAEGNTKKAGGYKGTQILRVHEGMLSWAGMWRKGMEAVAIQLETKGSSKMRISSSHTHNVGC